MFDDKPIAPQGQTPQNLPLGEPEDLFAETDASAQTVMPEVSAPTPPLSPPPSSPASALDAGVLKPKISPVESTPPSPAPMGSDSALENAASMPLKEPTMSRGIMTAIVIVVAVLLVGGAGWWVYHYINLPSDSAPEVPTTDFVTDESGANSNTQTTDQNSQPQDEETDTTIAPPDVTSSQPVDETILFGQIPDSDNDGLDDKREEALGTDPKKVDTDNDAFTDGDEVIVWGTDPLNPDTDGDGYLDGNEFKAGFNPKGPGKLFEAPKTP